MKEGDIVNNYTRRSKRWNALILIVLLILGVVLILPFIWMAVVAFERYANIQPPFPPSFLVKDPSLFNFKIITENGEIWSAYRNSFFVAVCSVAVNLVAVLAGGYALSKGKFKGKKLIFFVILITMMIPFETRMIPMFKMFSSINMTNRFLPLIAPNIIDGFGLLLAKQFFDELPDSLREAAQIDGAKEMRIFTHIFMPLKIGRAHV